MNARLTRRSFAALLAAGAVNFSVAQPTAKPIRIVLGFAPGGGADNMMRVLAQQMAVNLKQPVVIDNRPGADGILAADNVARSAPDGTSLLFGSNGPLVALPILRDKSTVSYDPFKDLSPIGLMGRFTIVMIVAPQVPAKTIAEFIALAKSKPQGLNYASANTVARMAAIQLMQQTQTNMEHIRYKGDSAALVDLMAGRVEMMFSTAAAAQQFVKDGKVRALMVLGDRRSPLLPDVPTAKEAGLHITVSPWAGLYGPANIPQATVNRLNSAMRDALASKEVLEQMQRLGFDPTASSPAEMVAIQRAEYDLFYKAVHVDGIQLD